MVDINMDSNKKYGLIVSDRKAKTRQPVFQATRNVFGDDSDSDEGSFKKLSLLRPTDIVNRQAKVAQEKAIEEDPTVFQYDEVYDSLTIEKEKESVKSKEQKKPRYIENLIKTANKRKIENERRIERQVQKEREKEGDEFADKEVFVTSAYKKKLEEMRLEDEKEKREEYLENIGDVTKQRDLGGFYRHLYEQKMGKSGPENVNPTETSFKKNIEKEHNIESNKRNYRKRKQSPDIKNKLSEGEIEDSDEEINRMNLKDIRQAKMAKKNNDLDADYDFLDDESSENDEEKQNVPNYHKKPDVNLSCITDKDDIPKKDEPTTGGKLDEGNNKIQEKQVVRSKSPQPKIDIWKKRTCGKVFEEALQRYYERKAARGM